MKRTLIAIACLLGGVLLLVPMLAAAGVLHLYRIPSSSMEPTLHCARPAVECLASSSDRVVTLRYLVGSPARGDLVAFQTPPLALTRCGAGGTFLKRVIGLPGDRWSERDGVVYIDGRRLAEPYVRPARRDARTVAPLTVPAGSYFLMGDNRQSSCDSRAWGTVRRSAIIGRVVATYWPPGRVEFH